MSMQAHDKEEFYKALALCCSTMRQPAPEPDALKLWARLLEPYSLADVKAALVQHMQQSKFSPVPADVIGRIDKRLNGWMKPGEAWAFAKRAHDEKNTVILCAEIQEALGAVSHLIEEGDYNAPKAFMAAYERISEVSRKTLPVPRWYVSPGSDQVQREQVVQKAVDEGRIALADGRAFYPALVAPRDSDAFDQATASMNRSKLAAVIALLKKPEAPSVRDMAEDVAMTRSAAAEQQRRVDERLAFEAKKREQDEREAALNEREADVAAREAAITAWEASHADIVLGHKAA